MNIFQWVVDESQRQPHWWGRQCVKAMLICAAISMYFGASKDLAWYIWAAIVAYCLFMISVRWYFTAHAERFQFLGRRNEVILSWAFVGLWAVFGFNTPADASWYGFFVLDAALESFATCRPPKPPKRKLRLSFAP